MLHALSLFFVGSISIDREASNTPLFIILGLFLFLSFYLFGVGRPVEVFFCYVDKFRVPGNDGHPPASFAVDGGEFAHIVEEDLVEVVVLDAVAHASTEIGIRGVFIEHDHAVQVDDHCYPLVVLCLHHLLLHHLKHFLLLKGIVLQQKLIINEKNVADFLLGEEIDQLGNDCFGRWVLIRFQEELKEHF